MAATPQSEEAFPSSPQITFNNLTFLDVSVSGFVLRSCSLMASGGGPELMHRLCGITPDVMF